MPNLTQGNSSLRYTDASNLARAFRKARGRFTARISQGSLGPGGNEY